MAPASNAGLTAPHLASALRRPIFSPMKDDAYPRDDATAASLRRIDAVARYMDARFRIPGTSIRFGWDAIIGLVPGLGDAATLIPAGVLIWEAIRLGAGKRILARMAFNTGVDFLIGGVPVLGDVFDLFFKANQMNADLLRREFAERPPAFPEDRP